MKPMVYVGTVGVRFADLDVYGHVNVSRYLDFIVTSRWNYAQNVLKISAADFIKKGVGIYVTSTQMSFLRSIVGLQDVVVTSQVKEINGQTMVVEFQLKNVEGSKTFCTGQFEQKFIDLATNKPVEPPEWVMPYHFDEV